MGANVWLSSNVCSEPSCDLDAEALRSGVVEEVVEVLQKMKDLRRNGRRMFRGIQRECGRCSRRHARACVGRALGEKD